jgi:hypothetical protein
LDLGTDAVGQAMLRRCGIQPYLVFIAVESEEQTEEDIQIVHELVGLCIKNTQTIILAVFQASNDIENQRIISKLTPG